MKRIRALFAEQRSMVAAHPFFEWLQSGAGPLEERFAFTPVMVDFTMGFADMNKWFLSYENPRDDLELSINQHTFEDRTHSRLFLENWHALGLDEKLGWPASQTLWWMYHCPQTLPVRRFGWDILRLAVQFPNPLVRFALMESIEICGDVFFRNTARVATQLSRDTGVEYRYYGEYHQQRETGHLHTDESPFFAAQLSAAELAQAEKSARCIFSGFAQVLDHLLSHCRATTALGSQMMIDLHRQCEHELRPQGDLTRSRASGSPRVSESQAPLLDFLAERKTQLAHHPFLAELMDAKADSVEQLTSFAASWAIDITGYSDFNQQALSYLNPKSDAERAINQRARSLSTHGIIYLQDWKALDLDQTLSWSTGETIGFYFLSEQTELHRRNLAKVTRYAFKHPEPLLRHWLMTAFEAGGDPLFDALAPVVERAEQSIGPLNYWAERHERIQPNPGGESGPVLDTLMALDISASEQRCISEMIGSLFDNFEEQLTQSHRQATEKTFLRAPGSLPPSVQAAPPYSLLSKLDQASAK